MSDHDLSPVLVRKIMQPGSDKTTCPDKTYGWRRGDGANVDLPQAP